MLSELTKIRKNYETISISPENMTGEKGKGAATPWEQGTAKEAARDLGTGWKVNPYFTVQPGEIFTLADVKDQGEIRQIWLTPTGAWRGEILRIYWDGEETPAVECPLGDFFACGLNEYAPVNSLPICVNPGSAFNCYWTMPFKKGFRITLENRNLKEMMIFFQITYIRKPVEEDAGYFHAQFRRENPTEYKKEFTMLDGVEGCGQYVGAYMTWGSNNKDWWGEGEMKAYIDGDTEFPSICYTGTEDYFNGSYGFVDPHTQKYGTYTTAYAGFCQAIKPDGLWSSQTRFGLYRFHITDPIYFSRDIRVTMQALGWRSGGRYLPLRDDLSCVAYFYLDKPSCKLPPLGSADDLELI